MYKIIEPGEPFKCSFFEGTIFKPIITIEGNDSLFNILVFEDKYMIFTSPIGSPDWKLKSCIFDKYFVEVLRLLPENPNDLVILNQEYYKQMLQLWQSEENFSLDTNILELEDLTRKIEEKMDEKKGESTNSPSPSF